MDSYLMNGHKLSWHLDRVCAWTHGEPIAPLHIDVGLSKGCNIKCEYCFGAVQGNLYKQGLDVYFPKKPLLRYIKDAGKAGVKSMSIIGEAEPLINPHVYKAIITGKKAGVDMALGTNGILFDMGKNGIDALKHLTWIRFNISAATEKSYKQIHNSKDFYKALGKIKFCVDTKKKYKLDTTIGLQMVLTPTNISQAILLAKLGKKLGVDYLVIKQCSDTVKGDIGVYNKLSKYSEFTPILEEAERISVNFGYQVIIKWKALMNEGRINYPKCLGAPFLLYSSGDGKLYSCGGFFTKNEYMLGDLTKQSFLSIIKSKRYHDMISNINMKYCYTNCKTHSINKYLNSLTNPPKHVNFI